MSSNASVVNNGNKINALTSQVKALSNQIANMKKGTPKLTRTKYLHERVPSLKEQYKDFKDNLLADFIYGLYHPDVVFNEHLDIKMPGHLPIPTTSFHFKDTFTIAPNSMGNFCLVWNPNFLGTSSELSYLHRPANLDPGQYNAQFSNVYWNNDEAMTGNKSMTGSWNCHTFKPIKQDFGKYRLTSACIKVKYTGKVLDQSGCLAACASYFTFPRSVLLMPNAQQDVGDYDFAPSDENLARFTDFDNIRQGQWAHTISVVSEPDGITCVYLPTDPLSEVFVNNGSTIDTEAETYTWQNTSCQANWTPKNANLSYAICGYGIDTITSCITVETYYNYEIIVRDDQVPYFRPTVPDARLVRFKDRITNTVQSVSGSFGGITRTKDHEAPSVMSRLRGAISSAWRMAGDIAPLVLKLGKAIL